MNELKMWYMYITYNIPIYILSHKILQLYIYIYYIYIILQYTQPQKEWHLAICDSIDGHREYHARWNKSDRKTNTVWSPLHVEFLPTPPKNQGHRDREQIGDCQRWRGRGLEKWAWGVKEYTVPLQNKLIQRRNAQAWWLQLAILYCTCGSC